MTAGLPAGALYDARAPWKAMPPDCTLCRDCSRLRGGVDCPKCGRGVVELDVAQRWEREQERARC